MRLSLREEIENYKQSELRKYINRQEIPLKFTIDNIDCYFYNRDLYGLFELNTEKNGIKPTDFLTYFKEGFLKGLNYFEEEENINLSTLRNDLTGRVLKRIVSILYEQEFILSLKGVLSATKVVPAIFTEKSIFNAGFYDGIIYKIDELLLKAGIDKEEILNSKPQTVIENPAPFEKPKATIQPEALEAVFAILKHYFDEEQQEDFKMVLETFGNVKNKLIFKGSGNKLADTFKKLYENRFITGVQKKQLVKWIAANFKFMHQHKTVTDFKEETLERIISTNQNYCKNPIIKIEKGKVLKIDR